LYVFDNNETNIFGTEPAVCEESASSEFHSANDQMEQIFVENA